MKKEQLYEQATIFIEDCYREWNRESEVLERFTVFKSYKSESDSMRIYNHQLLVFAIDGQDSV